MKSGAPQIAHQSQNEPGARIYEDMRMCLGESTKAHHNEQQDPKVAQHGILVFQFLVWGFTGLMRLHAACKSG
jgi:hypothetical protein